MTQAWLVVGLLVLGLSNHVFAQLDLESAYTLGNAGYGYVFAALNRAGNLIAASNPSGERQTVIFMAEPGQEGTPSGPRSGQVVLMGDKGSVTCGCIAVVNNKEFLVAGMSAPGFVSVTDLTFPDAASVVYMNATSSSLWQTSAPLPFASAVCQGQYVYFGTASATVANTVVRLNLADANVNTRFAVLSGAVSEGKLTAGAKWGDTSILFAMEPTVEIPATFFVINTASGHFELQVAHVTSNVDGFGKILAIHPSYESKTVTVANAAGVPTLATFDLSGPGEARLVQRLELDTFGLEPINTFTVDEQARIAYVTVGSCVSANGVVLVAVRLAPKLGQMEFLSADASLFDCTAHGVPRAAVLLTAPEDTLTAPAPRRSLFVFTKIDRVGFSQVVKHGLVLPYKVFGAGPCEANCHAADGNGECVGEKCFCTQPFTGRLCNVALPCRGTECNGHGLCLSDRCQCDVGFRGSFCEETAPCPLGCSNRGSCVERVCHCNEGFTGLGCEHELVGCASLNDCNSGGLCEPGYPSGICKCFPGYLGQDCGAIDTDASCGKNCSGFGVCTQSRCVCFLGRTGFDCSQLACPNDCSRHGNCENGVCKCSSGFLGDDCSVADTEPCPLDCSGHGTCVTGVCRCANGFQGPACNIPAKEIRVASDTALATGENRATTSFTVVVNENYIVFCLASKPGKCIAFNPDTMERVRDETFLDETPVLIQASEGRGSASVKSALMPAFDTVSSVSMLQTGVEFGSLPISVSVIEDTPGGFAILGTKSNGPGTAHGQLLKIGLELLTRTAEIEFDDDLGLGVTAGCNAGDRTFFFASGSSPAKIYRVNSELEILARVTLPVDGEVTSLVFDGAQNLAAALGNQIFVFQSTNGQIVPRTPAFVDVATSLGSVTTLYFDTRAAAPVLYAGTSASPAAVLRVALDAPNSQLESLRFATGENGITSIIASQDVLYFGLKSESNTCRIVKVSMTKFEEVDSVDIPFCTADLTTVSLSVDGHFAYFGTAGTPAHIYTVRLFSISSCPSDCNGHGTCTLGVCSCNAGFIGESCATEAPNCPKNCSNIGVCTGNVCECPIGYFGEDCSTQEQCLSKCLHGHCAGPAQTWPCECESAAWSGVFCTEKARFCPNSCSAHGVCDFTGLCICDPGYGDDDCGRTVFPIESRRGCVIDADCGLHGVCRVEPGSGSAHCLCSIGWSGLDCDIDDEFRQALTPNSISPALIAALVVLAVFIGMIAGVTIWKSWSGKTHQHSAPAATPTISNMNGTPGAATPSYSRIPRRLVKEV
eukprot:c39354_g1_i1.p1 GENE.c39354_g1_i1~~c39354_g1_i1.p1  ORF type:complete len:1296 (+),score=169.59 c39354_g1_i1:48-3890(+)